MAGLADMFLQKAMTPQNTGYMNAYNQGEQQAYGRGLSGALASGAPKQEVLSKLAYVDPVLAGKEMGVFSSSSNKMTETDKKAKQRADASAIGLEAVELANTILTELKANPNADITEPFKSLNILKQKYFDITGVNLKDPSFALVDEYRKQRTDARAESKEGREQQGDVEKAIKTWRTDNVIIQNLSKLENIASFAEEAKAGNPVAIKNLIAATSRLGSNEALSDSELQLMLTQNVGDQFDTLINRLVGTGTVFSAKDVNSAIKTLQSFAKSNLEKYKKLARGKAVDLSKTKGSSYSSKDLESLLLQGIPQTFSVNANANFADVPRSTESGGKNQTGVTAKEKRQIEFLVSTQKLSYEDALKKVKGL